MANPHPFIISFLWICIHCFLLCFAMDLLYMDLNSMYMHMLLFWYLCVYICHNIKEKKYIYINIYIKKRKERRKTSYEKGIFDSCF